LYEASKGCPSALPANFEKISALLGEVFEKGRNQQFQFKNVIISWVW
jgi:hypothetical protein